MSERNVPVEETALIDTNAEYIVPEAAIKEPPVLLSVSNSILIETIKDFLGSVLGFFLRYIRHFLRCFQYFWSPTLKRKPFNALDFKENSQHAFEFVILVLFTLIFLIKLDLIPPSNKELLETYGNDLSQKVMEVFLFLMFAVAYLLLAVLSVCTGRLFRKIFRINITGHESDILMVYLNNAFFSFAAIITLVIRSMASVETHEVESITEVVFLIVFPVISLSIIFWSIRFARLHGMTLLRGSLFFICTSLTYTLFYTVSTWLVSLLAIGF